MNVYINFRCKVPQCDGNESILETPWLPIAMPESNSPRRCSMYAPTNINISEPGTCSAEMFDQTQRIPCEEWIFGEGETVVKDVSLKPAIKIIK